MSGVNYLEMSDEELLKAGPPSATSVDETPADDAPAGDETPATDLAADDDQENDETPAATGGDAADDGADGDDSPGTGEAGEESKEEGQGETEGGTPDVEPKAEAKETTPKEAPVVDFEAEYNKLMAPFKANGREIQVQNVDEAVALMQMGANYNKKMAALKPNLKLLKMLENNGLLDAEKIGFLIDLNKKDPGAINKLVKESGLDPLDLTAEKADAYKQSSYAVGDQELELDTALDSIKESPAYTQTLDVVSNKWDGASKQIVAQAPQILTVLNDHIERGIYDLIITEVDRERTFGRLQGLSDIEAYRKVGDAMHEAGRFNHLAPKAKEPSGKPAPEPVVVPPKPKAADDSKRNDKRRAASSNPTPTPSAGPAPDFNPLAMSDEEFGKLINKRLL